MSNTAHTTDARYASDEQQEPVFLPPVTSFDVMVQQSIGTVELGPDGIVTPYEAAMRLIAKNDSPGVYTFPFPTGGVVTVTVEYPENKGVDNGR